MRSPPRTLRRSCPVTGSPGSKESGALSRSRGGPHRHRLWEAWAVSGRPHTFLFADLAGFTALTEAHGDEQAVALVGEFGAAVRRLLADHRAQEVKSIGDAVMIRGDEPAAAIRLGLKIVHEVGEQHGFPVVRVAMHTGSALERHGDWFGATVNLAARVSGAASGGEVLLTDATRAAAGGLEGVELRERGRTTLKNVGEPMLLYAAVQAGERDPEDGLPIDPVCRMAVDPEHSAGRLTHADVEYHFCSLECAARFAAAPDDYTEG
ncbi:MAG: YHS domain-containing protein [Actinobacteria bacterium]|nr:MAG: YHS domain-containing protein [Actinomycetota bacterium]